MHHKDPRTTRIHTDVDSEVIAEVVDRGLQFPEEPFIPSSDSKVHLSVIRDVKGSGLERMALVQFPLIFPRVPIVKRR